MTLDSLTNIAILASGNGTNAETIVKYCRFNPKFNVKLIISNRPEAYVLQRAENLRIDSYFLPGKNESEIIGLLNKFKIDLVCLCGYMKILSGQFLKKAPPVVNIHPSLLPQFPGKNAYKDAWDASVIDHGVTIHQVDQGIDTGPILLQKKYKNCFLEFQNFKHKGQQVEKDIWPLFFDQYWDYYYEKLHRSRPAKKYLERHYPRSF